MNDAVDPTVNPIDMVDKRAERLRVAHVAGRVLDAGPDLPEAFEVLANLAF